LNTNDFEFNKEIPRGVLAINNLGWITSTRIEPIQSFKQIRLAMVVLSYKYIELRWRDIG
jgi:hypothetical protein